MIFGHCPYCGSLVSTACAPKTPAFSKEKCGECHKKYWLKHSRIDPEAMTQEQFNKEYSVDETTKVIKRNGEGV